MDENEYEVLSSYRGYYLLYKDREYYIRYANKDDTITSIDSDSEFTEIVDNIIDRNSISKDNIPITIYYIGRRFTYNLEFYYCKRNGRFSSGLDNLRYFTNMIDANIAIDSIRNNSKSDYIYRVFKEKG